MRGNPRLAHPGDLLDFINRKLVFFEQSHDSQPGRVGQRAQGFQGISH